MTAREVTAHELDARATGRRSRWVVAVAALLAAVGCAEPSAPAITEVSPPWGPLAGSRIAIHGRGFRAAPGGVQVLFAGRPAPLVATVDDDTLDVLTPPAVVPGPVEVTVVIGEQAVRLADGFRYSRPPTIDQIVPATVRYDRVTPLSVTGTGFLDEDAGPPSVLIDGAVVVSARVLSDAELSVLVPPGLALRTPTLELVNHRGHAVRPRAFRYLPSDQPGLLLFGQDTFATFLDPVELTTVTIPWASTVQVRLTAVVQDDHGEYWGLDRTRRLGRLDLSEQRLDTPGSLGRWSPAMARVGDAVIYLDRSQRKLARLDLVTGSSVTLPATALLPCCGSYGLASDGATLYLVARDGATVTLRTIEPTTGEQGAPLAVAGPPGLHVEDMRFFAGTLYAVSRDGTVVTIDPATGTTTMLPVTINRVHAMEVFTP